jgi:hypothetical protein
MAWLPNLQGPLQGTAQARAAEVESRVSLHAEATQLFTDMGLTEQQRFLAWAAFETEPAGTVEIALRSFEGRNPGGLFIWFLGREEHKRVHMNGKRRTGYVEVRGTHGLNYRRDPRGTDSPPPGYDFSTRSNW